MRRLTRETADHIHPGNVVRFTYPSGTTDIGVVYGTPSRGDWGILCNRTDGTHFGLGLTLFNGDIEYEILENHEPVGLFGLKFDFCCNHEGCNA